MKTPNVNSLWQRSPITLALSAVLLLQLSLTACSPGNADEGREAVGQAGGESSTSQSLEQHYYHLAKSEQVVLQQGYQVERRFSGSVQVKQNAAIGFEQSGKVASLYFDEGDQVQQGDLLASQDTELLKIEREELKAQFSEIEAELNLTRTNLKRLTKLKQSGFTSTQSIDELQARQKVLLASRLRVKAALDANQIRIEKASLYAPFSARISQRLQDSGAVVSAGSPVFQLLQSGNSEVKIGVPVRLLDTIRQQKLLQLEINGQQYPTSLLASGAEVHPVTRTVALRFSLPETAHLVNGQMAYLTVAELHQAQGFWVPLTALTDGVRGMWNLYSLQIDNGSEAIAHKRTASDMVGANVEGHELYTLQSRNITVLHATQEMAYVSGALADGERILTAGLHRLVPGQKVRLQPQSQVQAQSRIQAQSHDSDKVVQPKPSTVISSEQQVAEVKS